MFGLNITKNTPNKFEILQRYYAKNRLHLLPIFHFFCATSQTIGQNSKQTKEPSRTGPQPNQLFSSYIPEFRNAAAQKIIQLNSKMPLRLLTHANMPYFCKSLHHLCPLLSPYVPPKFPPTSLGALQTRTPRRRVIVKATLDVPRRRVTRKSPILVPLQQEENQEEETPQPSIGSMQVSLDSLFIPPGVDSSELHKAKRLQGSNIVLSPYAKDGQINKAEFIKSSSGVEECPTNGYPEFALVGRSNVGKSSLVNSLVKRKQLAMTSKKPGKTQLINHFLINDSWYLVDLPGYGYAIAPKAIRTDWNEFTKDYFLNRKTLVCVLLLIDASIPAKQIDIDCATWLGQNKIPMTFVFTKCDKKKKKKGGNKRPEENIYDFQNLIKEFFDETPPWIMTSSVTNQGRDEMLLHISQLRNYWLEH